MIDGYVSGTIYGQPEERTDKLGHCFTVTKVLATTADSGTVIVNVIAFLPEVCDALRHLHEKDGVSVVGSLSPKVWVDKQGQPRVSVDMVARRIMSIYTDTSPS